MGAAGRSRRWTPEARVKISRVDTPIEEWRVLMTDHHPGYVTWEQYLATQARLLANARPNDR